MILTTILLSYCFIITIVAAWYYLDKKMYQILYKEKTRYADEVYKSFSEYLKEQIEKSKEGI